MISFKKFHGAGNDFIMIDNRENLVAQEDKETFAVKWCERRFGIGSDGVIFIENHPTLDFEMDFLNPDGSRSFCGNGSRCAVAFAKQIGMCSNDVNFQAVDGHHKASIDDGLVNVKMGDVMDVVQQDEALILHTGSPHYIKFVNNLKTLDVVVEGRKIRYSDTYKLDGINVNFIEEVGDGHIAIRTYERGVENETLACGTGATAAALAYVISKQSALSEVKLTALGGELKVKFNQQSSNHFTDVWLIGPAEEIFKGIIDG